MSEIKTQIKNIKQIQSLAKYRVCLEQTSSLTCFEYDLGMFESLNQVRILHRLR